MDKIIISQEDVDSLFKWRDNHKEYVRNFKPTMKDGVIEVYNSKLGNYHTQIFREIDGDTFQYSILHDNNRVFEFIWNRVTGTVIHIYNKLFTNDKETEEYTKTTISLHASIMAYIEYFSDKKEYVNVKTIQRNAKILNDNYKKNKKNLKKKHQVKITTKKVYSLNIDKNTVKRDKRRYEIKMNGWTVRGHWRRLKSGKKVWIKPYVKGDEKNVEPKEYRLSDD